MMNVTCYLSLFVITLNFFQIVITFSFFQNNRIRTKPKLGQDHMDNIPYILYIFNWLS